jgi:hypothetical protein
MVCASRGETFSPVEKKAATDLHGLTRINFWMSPAGTHDVRSAMPSPGTVMAVTVEWSRSDVTWVRGSESFLIIHRNRAPQK